jgi:hypothetical protein
MKEIKTELLLNGNDIPEDEFMEEFEKIIGISFEKWANCSDTLYSGFSEYGFYNDGKECRQNPN